MIKLLFLLLNAAKLSKILFSGGTMLLSVLVYGLMFGWSYAIGFVFMIFMHELGHYIAARQRGLDVSLPTFIPFVGAWIQMKDMPHDAETEAYVGVAGPLLGSLTALGCYFLARSNGSQMLLALAYSGFFLNLFNLIPLSPMDGGRITAVISPRLWFVGMPVLAVVFYLNPSPLLIMIGILAIPQLITAWKGATPGANPAYYQTSLENRMTYAFLYLGLVVFLALMTHDIHQALGGG